MQCYEPVRVLKWVLATLQQKGMRMIQPSIRVMVSLNFKVLTDGNKECEQPELFFYGNSN